MSPYTLTFRTSSGLLIKPFAYAYDAKRVMAFDFLKQTQHILSFNKQGDYNIFVSLPTGLRVIVGAFAFNSTSVQEIANIIRNAAASAFHENEGKNKLIVHLRHLHEMDQDVLFTLSYNPEADA
jgi:hypothetical protein